MTAKQAVRNGTEALLLTAQIADKWCVSSTALTKLLQQGTAPLCRVCSQLHADAKADLDIAAACATQKAAGVMEQSNFDKMLDLLTRDPDIFEMHNHANGASDPSQSDESS
jgi:hypothetical protein